VDSADRSVDSTDPSDKESMTYGSYPVDFAGESNSRITNSFK
jgi:hypothetical protein